MPTRRAARDRRPPLAVGHVHHRVADVVKAADWYESLGMRRIWRDSDVAVLEIRGGTHMVLLPAKKRIAAGTEAPFDFIVDDVDAARSACLKKGFKPGRMKRGSIHDSFDLTDPSGYRLTIHSSHASGEPV